MMVGNCTVEEVEELHAETFTYDGFVALMEEWAWREDAPLPSEQMRNAYWEVRKTPPWGYVVENLDWIDPEVVPLVNTLNCMRGVVTVESCCGHGEDPFHISFHAESGHAVRPLFNLISHMKGWRILFEGERDFRFTLEGLKGERAYREADELAAVIAKRKET